MCCNLSKRAFGGLVLLILFWILPASALEVPKLIGRVNDYANMISPDTRKALEYKLSRLEASDSTQIVILTIPSLQGESLEEYSIKVVEAWGIGQAGYDNGVLFLVARDDQKIRIEVGYGLEGRLTDLLAGRIVNNVIVPYFRAGRMDEGFMKGTDAIIAAVQGEFKGTGRVSSRHRQSGSGGPKALVIVFFIIAVVGSINRILGGIAGAILFPLIGLGALSFAPFMILFLIPIGFLLGLVLPFLFIFTGFGSGRFGGGSFGGGFGGGGFSGGGGGFGGGGASGGW